MQQRCLTASSVPLMPHRIVCVAHRDSCQSSLIATEAHQRSLCKDTPPKCARLTCAQLACPSSHHPAYWCAMRDLTLASPSSDVLWRTTLQYRWMGGIEWRLQGDMTKHNEAAGTK